MIDYLINRHLDPAVLDELRGTNIAINCTDLGKTWYVALEEKLFILDSAPDCIDVTVSSTVAGFLSYVLRQDRSELQVSGDFAVAEALEKTFGNLQIDWEEELSKHVGDVVAHQAMRFLKQLPNINLDQMIAEYLQHESQILPGKYAVREFMDAVDTLREDVDRLEARCKTYAFNN